MPEKIIEIPGVGRVSFPDSMSPDQMASEAARLHRESSGASQFPVGSPGYTREQVLAGKVSGDLKPPSSPELPSKFPKDSPGYVRDQLLGGRIPDNPLAFKVPESVIKPYIPSVRSQLRAGGALIGGAAGAIAGAPAAGIGTVPGAALGGAAGGSIGESVYQLGAQALGRPDAPETSMEAAGNQVEALAGGALQEGIPAALALRFPTALRQGAARNIESAVGAGTKSVGVKREVGKVAGEAVGGFPVSATTGGLLGKLEGKVAEAMTGVESAYNQFGNTKFLSKPIADELEKKVQREMVIQGETIPHIAPLRGLYDDMIKWFRTHPEFTLNEFRTQKQAWDNLINHTRAGLSPDPAKTQAVEEAANLVRDVMHQAVPELAKADRDAHVWITLRQTLADTDTREIGRHLTSQVFPRSALGGTAGAGLALAQGKNPYEGAAIGATLGALSQTAAWQSFSAAEKAALANALERTAAAQLAKGTTPLGNLGLQELMVPDGMPTPEPAPRPAVRFPQLQPPPKGRK